MDRKPRAGDGVPGRLETDEETLAFLAIGRRFKSCYRAAAADGLTKDDLRRLHGALWGPSIEEKTDPTLDLQREVIQLLLPDALVEGVLSHLREFRKIRADWERQQRERRRK
jgi:hypothetical protein